LGKILGHLFDRFAPAMTVPNRHHTVITIRQRTRVPEQWPAAAE
jgi:hypothetical protein